ncbi:MAG: hypothetical protein LBB18_03380 [Puniceicoccales bacterium]|nr:hypothetical protein [Puniceicoccales bacterium]
MVFLHSDIRGFDIRLSEGECILAFRDSETLKVFHNHCLSYVDPQKYPEILAFARQWAWGTEICESDNKIKSLEEGGYEIDVSGNTNIQALFADPEFKALNARYAEEAKKLMEEESSDQNLEDIEIESKDGSSLVGEKTKSIGEDENVTDGTPPNSQNQLLSNKFENTPTKDAHSRSNPVSPTSEGDNSGGDAIPFVENS